MCHLSQLKKTEAHGGSHGPISKFTNRPAKITVPGAYKNDDDSALTDRCIWAVSLICIQVPKVASVLSKNTSYVFYVRTAHTTILSRRRRTKVEYPNDRHRIYGTSVYNSTQINSFSCREKGELSDLFKFGICHTVFTESHNRISLDPF